MKIQKPSIPLFFLFCVLLLFSFLLVCSKQSKMEADKSMRVSYSSSTISANQSYNDSCIFAAKLWLTKNNLPDLIERFENEQKEKSEIDHTLNYSPGGFVVSEISSTPLKFSVSYHNSSTDASFVITWVVDFAAHRVYANPNEYGYDKEGVAF